MRTPAPGIDHHQVGTSQEVTPKSPLQTPRCLLSCRGVLPAISSEYLVALSPSTSLMLPACEDSQGRWISQLQPEASSRALSEEHSTVFSWQTLGRQWHGGRCACRKRGKGGESPMSHRLQADEGKSALLRSPFLFPAAGWRSSFAH